MNRQRGHVDIVAVDRFISAVVFVAGVLLALGVYGAWRAGKALLRGIMGDQS